MIAFAYAAIGPKNTALYTAMIDGLISNIQEVMPGEPIMMITDDETRTPKGVNVLRVPRPKRQLMTWRLKCHQVAHSVAEEIIFVEPDVRFNADVRDKMSGDFDITVTSREHHMQLEDSYINTSFTLGLTPSRNAEFWRQCKLYCMTLTDDEQDWFGDMLSVRHVIEGGAFKVKEIDGAIYNHIINGRDEVSDAKVLHYKGMKRKDWLFPSAVEA